MSPNPPPTDEANLPLPKGWIRTFSNSQKRYYYSHKDTKHTVSFSSVLQYDFVLIVFGWNFFQYKYLIFRLWYLTFSLSSLLFSPKISNGIFQLPRKQKIHG